MNRSRRAASILLALALAGATAAYGVAVDGEFHLDDESTIRTNFRLRAPDRVLDFSAVDLLGPGRPVTEITFALDFAGAGLAPPRYHVTSLALHLAAALLVFLLVRGALACAGHPRSAPLAAVVAGAFALHPIQSESVAYIAQRSEVLAALLGVGAVLTLLAADADWPRPRALVLSLAATALTLLALGAKTVAVAAPFAFVLHRLVLAGPPGRSPPLRVRAARALVVSAPAMALSVASIALNLLVTGPKQTAGFQAGELGSWRYLLTQLRVHWLYARLLAWPAGLSVDHGDYPPSPASPDATTCLAGLALVALVAAAAWAWREGARRPGWAWARPAAFGVFWWLLLLLPTSSFVPILDLVAEHRTYLPSVGLFLTTAVLVDAVIERAAPRRAGTPGLAVAVALLTALGAALAARAQVWRSEERLWADAEEKSPGSCRAATNHAFALQLRSDDAAAIAGYRRAQALVRAPHELALIARNLSVLHLRSGDLPSALSFADMGVGALPDEPSVRNDRAVVLWRLRRFAESVEDAERAVASSPEFPNSHDTLGLGLLSMGRIERAISEFRTASEIDPGESMYVDHEMVALEQAGRRSEGCFLFSALRERLGGSVPDPVRATASRLGCR